MGQFLFRVFLVALLSWVGFLPGESQGLDSHVDWVVSAQCSPEYRVTAPSRVSLSVASVTDAASTRIFGTLGTGATSTTQSALLNRPKTGWVSFIFPGPTFETQYYCIEPQTTRTAYFSYTPTPNFKLALSPSGAPTADEIAIYGVKTETPLQIRTDSSDPSTARLGNNTTNPYWLQYSISLAGLGNIETTLYSRF